MQPKIIVQEVGKRFRRYDPARPWTLQETLQRVLRGTRPIESFWALRNISFTVGEGRVLGIIGSNGSGKSTLLRLVAGVGRAEEGRIQIAGRLDAVLDLGAGFHPDLTGRENILVNGVVNGLTRREVAERLDSIVVFAELEEFIGFPLRAYSTGMQMRLAFAIATHTSPDILLVDEMLGVGDLSFQKKCLARFSQFKSGGCTILLVSHDLELVKTFCDDAIWLEAGKIQAEGPAREIVAQYRAASVHPAPECMQGIA
jgi:lipopolysaccharide transport system ATP-binding protein